jgi:hypothetical protein
MASERLLCALLWTVLVCLADIGIVRGQVPSAQPTEDLEVTALDARVQEFLDKIAADQAQQAFKDLLSGNPLLDGNKPSDALTNLIGKAAELKTNYGECLGVERVTAKKVGSRLVIFRYLYQCERFPVVWHFVFYRPPQRRDAVVQPSSSWYVITVRFDTELERLID